MRAVALGLLGYGTDADDAVQDAMLTAMSKLGGLRDPAAAGPPSAAISPPPWATGGPPTWNSSTARAAAA